MSDIGQNIGKGLVAIGGALLLGGIGLGIGIAAGPGILGSILLGAVGGAVGAGVGLIGGLVYADKSDDIAKFFKNAKKSVKAKLGQGKGLFAKLRQNMSETLENASEKMKNGIEAADVTAKSAPKAEKASDLGNKTAKSDFADKAVKTEQTVTETPAPAQNANVKKTVAKKTKSAKRKA